jgi:hypothetical protein
MENIKIISLYCIVILIVSITAIWFLNGVQDFFEYQSILEDNNTSWNSWYSQNWFYSPYTNFRLSQYPSTFHIAKLTVIIARYGLKKRKRLVTKHFGL